jgi:uncharacterized membrane-anchored protein
MGNSTVTEAAIERRRRLGARTVSARVEDTKAQVEHRDPEQGDAMVAVIVLYAGLVASVGLLLAGLVTHLVDSSSNAVGLTVFLTVLVAVAGGATVLGERAVRRLPR